MPLTVLFLIAVQLEVKLKGSTLPDSARVHFNFTSILFHDRLTDSQTKAYAVPIKTLIAIFEFTKGLKELSLVLFRYTDAIITNLNIQAPQRLTIVGLDLDDTFMRKLERILDQIYQDLL